MRGNKGLTKGRQSPLFVHMGLNFQIVKSSFVYDVNFFHFFLKSSQWFEIFTKKSKIFTTHRRYVVSSLKNDKIISIHNYWKNERLITQSWALSLKSYKNYYYIIIVIMLGT